MILYESPIRLHAVHAGGNRIVGLLRSGCESRMVDITSIDFLTSSAAQVWSKPVRRPSFTKVRLTHTLRGLIPQRSTATAVITTALNAIDAA
jgi:hypothetical protein